MLVYTDYMRARVGKGRRMWLYVRSAIPITHARLGKRRGAPGGVTTMPVFDSLIDTIGRTPVIHITRFDPTGRLFAKTEGRNPGGSAKDRPALYMIRDAMARGVLREGGAMVEPTSGNTGVGLAWIAAVMGLKLVLTMPETMSVERRKLLAMYGAQIVLTPGAEGMAGAIRRAEEIAAQTGAFMPMQFENPANPLAHEHTTAREILEDMDGSVGAIVAGVGTGGTLTGIARAVKRECPSAIAIAVEPDASAVLSGGKAGPHKLQGIGAGFVPGALDVSLIDRVVTVGAEDAFAQARRVARTEGILCGISSGAALQAALQAGVERTVVILPDTGERYLSTELCDI